MTNKPNIVFFFTDDQRFDTIAALGNEAVETPHLDSLVKAGTSFTHAHIPGGTVGAVCMPSRGMLHTGRTLYHLEDNGSQVPKHHALLGETLQQNGYRTFGTGKWHNGKKAYARSFTDGAEIFFGGMSDHWNVPAYHYDPTGEYAPNKVILSPWDSNQITLRDCDHIHAGKHSSELFCDCACRWLDAYTEVHPFFMYVSFMAPHDPRSMPDRFLNMYNPKAIHIPESFCEEHFNYGVREIRDELLTPYPRDKQAIQKHLAEYYGMISHLDNELGKVISTLKEKGIYDNTLIIFAGDNGLALGQHGLMGKQSCYEHSIRVPLIFAGPGIPKGKKTTSYAYLLDIFPTLCDLLEIPIPPSVEGVSLVPALVADEPVREDLYFAYGNVCRSVKDSRYKLIEYQNEELGVNHSQLFDLEEDPQECTNLINDSSHKAIISKLRDTLQSYRHDWNEDQHPIGEAFWANYERNDTI